MNPVKQKLCRLIDETLHIAQRLPAAQRRQTIRQRLEMIQSYCASVEKTFIFFELSITCDQYDLGGSVHNSATLFRGPNEDASVAICITEQGSLLHRNESAWRFYCHAEDVNPPNAILPAVAV